MWARIDALGAYIVAGWGWGATALVALLLINILWRCARPTRDLHGKLVLVTGGSQGIGLALARDLVQRGAAHVVLLARTEAKLQQAVEQLSEELGAAEGVVGYVCADVTDAGQVRAAVEQVVEKYGMAPSVLVACAGASYPGYFLATPEEVFERCMALNYMGTVNVVKAVAPHMVEKRDGAILLVASAAAVVSYIGYSSYSPTKYALRGLGDALRNELGGFGVQVSIAYPPDTATPGFEKERETKPAENRACFPDDPYKADAVAKATVGSFLGGDYHVQSPDVLQNLLVSSMSGVTPRPMFVLELLLSPLVMVATALVWRWFDYQAGKYGQRAAPTLSAPPKSKVS